MLSYHFPVYLASTSPRRREILKKIVSRFEVLSISNVETSLFKGEPEVLTRKNAYLKMFKAKKSITDPCYLIISADTLVVISGKIFGKPTSREEAINFWQSLVGKTHEVITGVAFSFVNNRSSILCLYSEKAFVTFNHVSSEEVISYIDRKKPYDKAGAYGIQELPIHFISKIEGDMDNIIGLPCISLEVALERYS